VGDKTAQGGSLCEGGSLDRTGKLSTVCQDGSSYDASKISTLYEWAMKPHKEGLSMLKWVIKKYLEDLYAKVHHQTEHG
jgi:hypothetical protein